MIAARAIGIILAAALAVAASESAPAKAPAPAKTPAASEAKTLGAAIKAADRRKWGQARALAKRLKDPLAAKIATWYRLSRVGAGAPFRQAAGFVADNPDWPEQKQLRRLAEDSVTGAVPAADVVAWFRRFPPQTARGAMRYIEALGRAGERQAMERQIRKTWATASFRRRDERTFLKRYRARLRREDHEARIERLLWRGYRNTARRLLRTVEVDKGFRRAAEARLLMLDRWRAQRKAVRKAIKRIPEHYRQGEGLIYEQVRWHRRRKRDDEARTLLRLAPKDPARPDRWWLERSLQVRRSLLEGKTALAYELARDHRQHGGRAFVEAEWLAGWIALRFTGRPEDAFRHFARVFAFANFPISIARGAYWMGRSAEAEARPERAEEWYRQAAKHPTAFYGQLAAARLGLRTLPIPQDAAISAGDAETFERRELVRAARLLHGAGQTRVLRPVLLRLYHQAASAGERALVASLADDLGRRDIAVRTAKRALRDGLPLYARAYPVIEVPGRNGIERPLLLALIRQESEFNPKAVSRAGARGLMQLMPTSARRQARRLGLRYSRRKLTRDVNYNMRLGAAHFAGAIKRYGGSYVLALAAYNAGGPRVRRWVKDFGDPRRGHVDAVDWVESIPFKETRNYVQRVLEGMQVYRARLGQGDLDVAGLLGPGHGSPDAGGGALACAIESAQWEEPVPC